MLSDWDPGLLTGEWAEVLKLLASFLPLVDGIRGATAAAPRIPSKGPEVDLGDLSEFKLRPPLTGFSFSLTLRLILQIKAS